MIFTLAIPSLMWSYSETLELSWNNRISSIEPNRIFSIFRCFFEFDRTELCFIAFEWFYMMYLMHLNYFYEFGSIEPNSKKHRNIEKIRFGSIELIRLFQESSRVSLYYFYFFFLAKKLKIKLHVWNYYWEINYNRIR